jgi:serine protease AprX
LRPSPGRGTSCSARRVKMELEMRPAQCAEEGMGLTRDCGVPGESRLSALWGKREGESRSRLRISIVALASLALMLAAPSVASADAFVPPELRGTAQANPNSLLHVIVVAEPGVRSGALKNELMKDASGNQFGQVRREFKYVLDGVAADLKGSELLYLAAKPGIKAITPDGPVRTSGFSSPAVWPLAIGTDRLSIASLTSRTPTIAVVDTGVDKNRIADFGSRVLATLNFSSLKPDPSDSSSDYSGHGTLVAGIAAGASTGFPGVAPKSNIVSLRVTNAEGRAVTSDVIAAADWIYENRSSYNIRIVNFSLNSPYANYGLRDPLNEAVRRLWLTGTVVVVAAGNNGGGSVVDAPASEPFVITVGATDVGSTPGLEDDTNAPWSSHGHTADGFAKPELAAPGRYMAGPIARTSRLVNMFPSRVVAPGYMWMSGTSFAAPVVSGAAAQILASNPSFTPDQVKGALMATANALPLASPGSVGVGQVDLAAASALAAPPNPNAPLLRFLRSDSRVPGGKVFDTEGWADVAAADPSWYAASWDSVTWSDASWSDVTWSDVTWSDVTWSDATWSDATWSDATWSDVTWSDATWSD